MKPIPTPAELQKYNVNLPGQVEGIRQSLYDIYTSQGTVTVIPQTLNFFQVPIGQGTGSAGNAKTYEDTNMNSAGQLPTPKLFLVENIGIHFYPAVAYSTTGAVAAATYLNEVQKFIEKGYLEFFIGSKPYLDEAPIGRFPPQTYTYGFTSIASAQGSGNTTIPANAVIAAYAAASGKPYAMEPPIVLIPNQNFNVSLNWPNAQITGMTAGYRIGVVLSGILYRNSQ